MKKGHKTNLDRVSFKYLDNDGKKRVVGLNQITNSIGFEFGVPNEVLSLAYGNDPVLLSVFIDGVEMEIIDKPCSSKS